MSSISILSLPPPSPHLPITSSLETKALSTNIVPTVTCTSSNVVQTMLQSAAQIPNLTLWYGPDTCMGYNIQTMFGKIVEHWTDEVRTGVLREERKEKDKHRSKVRGAKNELRSNAINHLQPPPRRRSRRSSTPSTTGPR